MVGFQSQGMPYSRVNLFDRRRAGILLHVTSLPGPSDGGVLGEDALKFIDLLEESGFSIWQMLPLGPVDSTLSPYSVRSGDAGNPRLIDLDPPRPPEWWLTRAETESANAWETRRPLLRELWNRFCRLAPEWDKDRFLTFVRRERAWLQPFALYEALRSRHGRRPWWKWPEPLRARDPEAIGRARRDERRRIRQTMFEQYLFHEQWHELKDYANRRGVYLFGDMPVYVDPDSVEVWWRRELFQVDLEGRAAFVSGVPPDYFSEDGQLWGHPIYDWNRLRSEGYRWWINRCRQQLNRFDLLRIDHFRAFDSYWEIPADATSARNGRWVPGPGGPLLEALAEHSMIGSLVAEDLGVVTPSVRKLRDDFHLPGMLVLQFAFDGSDDNPFLRENHTPNAVVYTGTHDNDTTVGWSRSLPTDARHSVCRRLGVAPDRIPETLIDHAYRSPAQLAVLPMQDLLGLGSEHRMNTPGTTEGNWAWRFRWEELPVILPENCRRALRESGRLVPTDSSVHISPW